MFENQEPLEGQIIPPPVPFVYRPRYTNKTNVFIPILLRFTQSGAVMGLEWTTLYFIENAPIGARIATFVTSLLILAVIQLKVWLDFKKSWYFASAIIGLVFFYSIVVVLAFVFTRAAPAVDPVVTELQSQLATTRRDRDLAIVERDTAKRENGQSSTPLPPVPVAPPAATVDDIDARIDAWNSIEGQMNDLSRFLSEGDGINASWKTNQTALMARMIDFRSHIAVFQDRLSRLLDVNRDFSDLKAVDATVLAKLAVRIQNTVDANDQLPKGSTQANYETSITPYMNSLARQLALCKQWNDSIKTLSVSSIADLSARRASK